MNTLFPVCAEEYTFLCANTLNQQCSFFGMDFSSLMHAWFLFQPDKMQVCFLMNKKTNIKKYCNAQEFMKLFAHCYTYSMSVIQFKRAMLLNSFWELMKCRGEEYETMVMTRLAGQCNNEHCNYSLLGITIKIHDCSCHLRPL